MYLTITLSDLLRLLNLQLPTSTLSGASGTFTKIDLLLSHRVSINSKVIESIVHFLTTVETKSEINKKT